MANEPTTITVNPDSELARAIDAADPPVVLVVGGVRYRLSRDDEERDNPDPDRVRAVLAATAGSWADLDIDRVIDDLYTARTAGTRPPERP